MLQIPDQWTECSVVFHTTDPANPGRLTLSSLSANPASYWFSNFSLTKSHRGDNCFLGPRVMFQVRDGDSTCSFDSSERLIFPR